MAPLPGEAAPVDAATASVAAATTGADPDDDRARQAAWDALTDVERTCLGVLFWRTRAADEVKHPATGAPLFEDAPSRAAVVRALPAAVAAEYAARRYRADGAAPVDRVAWIAARTAELDRQLLLAAAQVAAAGAGEGAGTPLQVVILGAGMDARAWRLAWPPPAAGHVSLFEVDQPNVLAIKTRAFEGAALAPSVARRATLACDLRETDALAAGLKAQGFDTAVPTVWLLEGLIGYLTREDGAKLLKALAGLSARGSRVVMTAPPSERERSECEAEGHKLHHATFESPHDTLARAEAAGWQGAVVTSEEAAARWGVERAQAVLVLGLAPPQEAA